MGYCVFGYIIYSTTYNAIGDKNVIFFGAKEICNYGDKGSPFYKKCEKKEKEVAEYAIRKRLQLQYGKYLFLETDIPKYNRKLKEIDDEIKHLEKTEKIPNENGRFTYPKKIIEKINILKQSKEKYKIITNEKDKFLHLLGTKYYDEVDRTATKKNPSKHTLHIKWVDGLKLEYDKKSQKYKSYKENPKVVKYFYDNYINHENNKHNIIYHHLPLPLTDEEKALRRKEHTKKWREKNIEKFKEKQKIWKQENKEEVLKHNRNHLYYKKLLPLTKEQVREIEKEIKKIVVNIERKQQVHKFCDMILADKKNHIIIKKMMKELDQKTMMSSVSTRLAYLKKINHQ